MRSAAGLNKYTIKIPRTLTRTRTRRAHLRVSKRRRRRRMRRAIYVGVLRVGMAKTLFLGRNDNGTSRWFVVIDETGKRKLRGSWSVS